MQNAKVTFDTSKELIVQKLNTGIRLIKPEKIKQANVKIQQEQYSLSEIFQLPFSIYFLNHESQIMDMNEANLNSLNLDSLTPIIGKTAGQITKTNDCNAPQHDKIILKIKKMSIFEEFLVRNDDIPFTAISVKHPWIDEDNNVIGIFGCSFMDEKNSGGSLSHFLSILSEWGLLSTRNNKLSIENFNQPLKIKNVKFSKRESLCIHYLMLGKTIKAIANLLGISSRTVNHYLENIKFKMGVTYKSELIEKLHDLHHV